ncbi:transcriptional regulator [Aerococcaceae bacterium NML190073]|nr:transcriptional regulator [Aerococcaceae bacterium NML190073]
MSLFPKLDEKKTKENAQATLAQYRLLKRIAGEKFEPRVTATYSFEPRSQTNLNSNAIEKHIARQVSAQQELERIEEAINSVIGSYERQVLIEKYCKRYDKTDIAIYMDLGYTESEFYRLLDRALYEFAETYRHGELLVFENGLRVDEILGDFC